MQVLCIFNIPTTQTTVHSNATILRRRLERAKRPVGLFVGLLFIRVLQKVSANGGLQVGDSRRIMFQKDRVRTDRAQCILFGGNQKEERELVTVQH
jgi:hypothetical protein